MARFFFDLLILAALCKEVLVLNQQRAMGHGLFLTTLLVLSFFLGIAPGEPGLAGVIRDPIRSLIRNGIAVFSLSMYLQIQLMTGALWTFGLAYAVILGLYLLGRLLGLAWRAVWFLLGLLLAIWAYSYFVGARPVSP